MGGSERDKNSVHFNTVIPYSVGSLTVGTSTRYVVDGPLYTNISAMGSRQDKQQRNNAKTPNRNKILTSVAEPVEAGTFWSEPEPV